MNRSTRLFLAVAALFIAESFASSLFAQAVGEAPRSEYYLAREMYEAGRLADASEGFQLTLARSMKVREQPWIDSIPPLVMLGEAYFQSGKVAQAMEQYDAALMIALGFPDWIDQVSVAPELLPYESKLKGINWFIPSRASQVMGIPEPGQLTVNPGGAGAGQPMAVTTRVDTAEILRSMGLAVIRRGEILGPLAVHSPLAEQLNLLFERNLSQPAPWAKSAWRLLQGFQALSVPGSADPIALISEHAVTRDDAEYFMTPLALIELGKYEWLERDLETALTRLKDATLIAARYEQYSTLAEALRILSATCSAENRVELLPALQSAATWGVKRSASVHAQGFAGAAELATVSRDWAAAESNSKQAASALRMRDVALPRAQAQLFYANALTAFGQNRAVLGQQALESALKIMRGNAQDGALAKQIFQSQLVLNLLQGGALQAADAEQALEQILQEPGPKEWKAEPLETIAAMTTSAIPAYATWLELAERRGSREQIVERMDRIQRQRFFEASPLGGRLFSLRAAVMGDQQQLPADVQAAVTDVLRSSPELTDSTQRLANLSQSLEGMPLPLEERSINSEGKKFFAEYTKAIEVQESQLTLQALRRQPFDRFLPFAAKIAALQESLGDTDLVIGFVSTGGKLYAAALNKTAIETWSVAEVGPIDEQITKLLAGIGLSTASKVTPSEVTAIGAEWRAIAANLHGKLFPVAIQKMISEAGRIAIVPDGSLWYLPFELLPSSARAQTTWLVEHPIVYMPTLGSIELLKAPAPTIDRTLHIASNLFSTDKSLNETLTAKLIRGAVGYQRFDLPGKNIPAAAHWSRMLVDQLLLTSKIEPATQIWESNFLPLDNTRFSQLIGWSESPRRVPSRVLLPGYQTAAAAGNLADGRELFMPACALLYSGSSTTLLSRWPVGGRSTQTVLSRFLRELGSEAPSTAWRRSVAALWADEFWIADEPAMLPSGKESAALVSGGHPKLWSGYMVIGDSQSPPTKLP